MTAFVPVQIRLVTPISEFESGQQSFRQFVGTILHMGWFNRGSNPQSAITDSMVMRVGETPYIVRGSETSARAQPEDDLVGMRKRFPRRWTAVSCFGLQDF